MELVLDASVIVKWFLLEEGYLAAREYRKQAYQGKISLHATELLYFEIGNALLSKDLPREAIDEMMRDVYATPVALHPFSSDLCLVTIRSAMSGNITIYDASYVALAQRLGCPFVTADERIATALRDVPDVQVQLFSPKKTQRP